MIQTEANKKYMRKRSLNSTEGFHFSLQMDVPFKLFWFGVVFCFFNQANW